MRVLFIGGWGRSGSTLLDRMLGEVPGFVSVGELREVWQRGCAENRQCGCGRPFSECSFWQEVGEVAFGGWGAIDVSRLTELRYRHDRVWRASDLLRANGSPDGLTEYTDHLRRLYDAIAAVSGAEVVVDSSKLATHALVLARIPQIDLRVVHLVRDSRGVAYSWRKLVERPDGNGDRMYRYGTLASSGRYVVYNLLTSALAARGLPYLRLRYEDLVADAGGALETVIAHAGGTTGRGELAFVGDGHVRLGVHHTVDGNPMRFSQGPVPLRADEAWRSDLPRARRAAVTTLTAPLLLRYGYWRAAPGPASSAARR